MAKEEKQAEVKERYSLVRILTNDAPIVIQDSKTGDQLDTMTALVRIMNMMEKLQAAL